MHLHYDYNREKSVVDYTRDIHDSLFCIPQAKGTCRLASLGPFVSRLYAAGVYAFLLSQVWEADAFDMFLENGIFDRDTGMSFRKNILAKGSSEDPRILFERFRGRSPSEDALIKRALNP